MSLHLGFEWMVFEVHFFTTNNHRRNHLKYGLPTDLGHQYYTVKYFVVYTNHQFTLIDG